MYVSNENSIFAISVFKSNWIDIWNFLWLYFIFLFVIFLIIMEIKICFKYYPQHLFNKLSCVSVSFTKKNIYKKKKVFFK